MSSRLVTLVTLASLAAATTLVAQDEAPPLFVDKIDVNVVNVEVFVTDEDGNRVIGLGIHDFEIFEDGRPVEITNFFATARPDRLLRGVEPPTPEVERLPAPAEQATLPLDQRLSLVVYVDHYNLTPANRRRVLDELDGFLEDRLIQGDSVMLIGAYRSAKVVTPLTRDYQEIEDGLKKLGKAPTYRQIDDAHRRRIMRQTNSAAVEGELDSAIQFVRSYIQGAQHDLNASVGALRRVVRSLAGLPGRKAVLYVSEGLPQRPGEELYQDLLDRFGISSIREAQTPARRPSTRSTRPARPARPHCRPPTLPRSVAPWATPVSMRCGPTTSRSPSWTWPRPPVVGPCSALSLSSRR